MMNYEWIYRFGANPGVVDGGGWPCKKYCVSVGNRVFLPILLSLRSLSHGREFDSEG